MEINLVTRRTLRYRLRHKKNTSCFRNQFSFTRYNRFQGIHSVWLLIKVTLSTSNGLIKSNVKSLYPSLNPLTAIWQSLWVLDIGETFILLNVLVKVRCIACLTIQNSNLLTLHTGRGQERGRSNTGLISYLGWSQLLLIAWKGGRNTAYLHSVYLYLLRLS